MGMYDEIICEFPLPMPKNQGEMAGRNWRENRFQTKDFHCLGDEYCIHEDGTLWQRRYTLEQSDARVCSRKATGWQPVGTFTGTVHFYDFVLGTKADYWAEWVAVIVSGQVAELALDSWEERDNRERLANDARMKSEQEQAERFLTTSFGRHIYPTYAWLVQGCFTGFLHRVCNWAGDTFHRAAINVHRMGDKLAPYGDPIRQERRRRIWTTRIQGHPEE